MVARPRTIVLGAMERPVNRHPLAIRVAVPRLVQSPPLAFCSKKTFATSGLAPPRSQVIVEEFHVRLWVALVVLFSRPKREREEPPKLLKAPPTRTLPSPCCARE